ncbi:MAG: SIS domain-containing protein [Candidatus Levybacteria bacterium]|nr:SIS domain-containing protein [Candidatus Levybacteria bacterium]
MNNFTDLDAIRKIDPQDTLGSTELAIKQCKSAWEEVHKLTLPQDIGEIKNIVCCGMGASIYGGLVLKSLLGRNAPYPVEIISDYHIPSYVDEHTLVILTSYSGTTEETISCAHETKAQGAKMLIITKGGPLADFAKTNNTLSYIFDPKLNPAGVPRLGNGYTIVGLLAILSRLNVIDLEEKEMNDCFTRLEERQSDLKKRAMADYEKFETKIPVVVAAEHVMGNAHILRNQFNETGKTFSCFFIIPDLNHHLMEGLKFPNGSPLHFLLLTTDNYTPKIQKRIELTADVIKQNGHTYSTFATSGSTLYEDFFEVLIYGAYLTLFLALSHDQNPAINPFVDYFKEKLAGE